MGGSSSVLTEEQLEDYKKITSFSRGEILRLWDKFYKLCDTQDKVEKGQSHSVRVGFVQIKTMPELKENPFKHRICQVFATKTSIPLDGEEEDDLETDSLSFENFLDMVFIFSEQASHEKKLDYAFKMYDDDNDGYIGRDDLYNIVTLMTSKSRGQLAATTDQGTDSDQLTDQEINILTDKIMDESDLDHDQRLSKTEFENIVSQAPHFFNVFHIRF